MNFMIRTLTWSAISLQGLVLLLDGQSRDAFYTTFSHIHAHGNFSIDDVAEIFRLVLAFLMIPAALYSRKWSVLRLISFIAFITSFNICRNLVLFLNFKNVSFLLVDLLLFGLALTDIVDSIVENSSKPRHVHHHELQKDAPKLNEDSNIKEKPKSQKASIKKQNKKNK